MIRLGDWAVSLDRRESGANVDFVSHAHTDHISSARSSSNILASQETLDLLDAVHGIKAKAAAENCKNVKLLDAGHVLGSKQILVNDEQMGASIVYTGDFQLQESRACRKIEMRGADIAVVDSTYYDPEINFGDRAETERAVQLWTEQRLNSGIAMFGAYSIGKSQELISILNEIGIVPVVGKRIALANRAYKNAGVKLDYASEMDNAMDYQQLTKGNFAAIVESHTLNVEAFNYSNRFGKRISTAVATGLSKMMKFNVDVQFPLSDHADFKQVTEYIDNVDAKEVVTYGNNSGRLAEVLNKRGYNAQPFVKGSNITHDLLANPHPSANNRQQTTIIAGTCTWPQPHQS